MIVVVVSLHNKNERKINRKTFQIFYTKFKKPTNYHRFVFLITISKPRLITSANCSKTLKILSQNTLSFFSIKMLFVNQFSNVISFSLKFLNVSMFYQFQSKFYVWFLYRVFPIETNLNFLGLKSFFHKTVWHIKCFSFLFLHFFFL